MRFKIIVLSVLLAALSHLGKAQMIPEHFVHCFGNDTLLIEKISETVSGDTVIKEFRDHVFDPNGSFNYYFFNDSIFIKYHGEFYLIGDNNAEVGDVWHPIRFNLMSYSDTTESCPMLMNLQVIDVDTVTIDGQPTRYFSLKDIDWWTATEADHRFLSGKGATLSGPFYNLSQQMPCNVFPHYSLSFRSYQVGDFEYIENRCITSINDIEDPRAIHAYPNPTSGVVTIDLQNLSGTEVRLRVSDVTGSLVHLQKSLPTEKERLDLSFLPSGIYQLEVLNGSSIHTQKLSIIK